MNIFNWFKRKKTAPVAREKKTAPVAKERLHVMLAHERASTGRSELIAGMRKDIVAVIARHVGVKTEDVRVKINRRDTVFTLKINMDMPSRTQGSQVMGS